MEDHIRQSFIRQRRNLILISLVVLFVEVAGVEIKAINVLGNELIIREPHVVEIALWIALIYWLIRYYQLFRDLPERELPLTYQEKMNAFVPRVAYRAKRVKEDMREQLGELGQCEAGIVFRDYNHEIIKAMPWYYKINVIAVAYRGDSKDTGDEESKRLQDVRVNDIEVAGGYLILPNLRALWSMTFGTRGHRVRIAFHIAVCAFDLCPDK